MKTFDQKFVDSAVEHVNEDHRDAMVDILTGLCEANWVTDAELIHFDKEKMEVRGFNAEGREEIFTVPYDAPLEKSNQFRPTLIALLQRARAELK
ncbi:MAG: DUF2470 domain-containing protein [Cyclobacteriaceae bacterium]